MVEAASILIADDEEVFRETTADLLRLRGYRCDCVAAGRTALSALDDERFDLLVADIRMPGNAELQLVEEVRRNRPGLPVILVTGAPSLDSAIRSVQLPVAAYLTKPLELDSFYRHVDRCIVESTTRRMLRDARQVFAACTEKLEALEAAMSGNSGAPTSREVAATANAAVCAVLDGFQSIEPLWQRCAGDKDAAAVQALLTSPREIALQEAMEYAVLALERTRKSFKSKELGELRARLTGLLKKGNRPT
ncbi:MAG: response regulator [Pirellulales bacterium]|nr:response regulator [Pirellulales bacterium]